MNRSRLIGIPTAVAALTLGALASADPAAAAGSEPPPQRVERTANASSSWIAFARHADTWRMYKGTGSTASAAKTRALANCKEAHRMSSWKCKLAELHKT